MSKIKKVFKVAKKVLSSPIGQIGLGLALPGLGTALGTGLGVSSAVGTGLAGAAAGALSGGGLKGALLGGAGGYLAGGGLGHFAGAPAGNLIGPTNTGSGLLGSIGNNAIGRGINSVANVGGGGSSYGGSSLGGGLKSLLSTGIGVGGNNQAAEELIKQQKKNAALYSPFLNARFDPADLENDPGYKFQLGQGLNALSRRQSAGGNYFSGQALKEAQDYGQGLAGTTFQNAFGRFNAQQAQNMGATGLAAGVNDNIGTALSNRTINNSNIFSQGLSGLLGGQAIGNTGALLGGGGLAELMKTNPELFRQIMAGGGASQYGI